MIDLDNDRPFDTGDAEHERFLRNLQGNVLKGHGRNYTANIFLEFHKTGPALRDALRELTARYVTSAHAQLQQSRDFRDFGLPGSIFGNLFLRPGAYTKLGFGDRLATWFADPPAAVDAAPTQSFVHGMRNAAAELGDRPDAVPDDALGRAYRAGTIDAMLLLADDAENFLLREAREAVDRLAREGVATARAVEIGRALRNDDDEGIEHFGYVDGRSQPLFLRSDFTHLTADGSLDPARSREKTNDKRVSRETGRIDVWNPFAPLGLVLLPDPGTRAADAFGSYYVFRKLEQDVLHFCMAEQALADTLGLEGRDRPRAGAMVIGRFRDGTPLALNETDGFVPAKANNFRYDGRDAGLQPAPGLPADPFALKCPFQAHIRRVNPRQSVDDLTGPQDDVVEREREDRSRRIVRRGITYGERSRTPTTLPALDDLPTGGVGLLFACFQRSIVRQFAFLQQKWVRSIAFPLAGGTALPGEDPLLAPAITEAWRQQRWRAEYDGELAAQPNSVTALDMAQSHPMRFGFGGFVTFRGGEYFFAPSLPFLRGEYDADHT